MDRLRAITLTSSSFNGRLLYDLDGLQMLLRHPLGVGRGGYLYIQPLEQTGGAPFRNRRAAISPARSTPASTPPSSAAWRYSLWMDRRV